MSKTIKTDLVCPECGNVFPIMRKASRQRGLFHRKRLYCIVCKKETNHIETKDFDMLLAAISFKGEDRLNENEKEVYQLVKKRSE